MIGVRVRASAVAGLISGDDVAEMRGADAQDAEQLPEYKRDRVELLAGEVAGGAEDEALEPGVQVCFGKLKTLEEECVDAGLDGAMGGRGGVVGRGGVFDAGAEDEGEGGEAEHGGYELPLFWGLAAAASLLWVMWNRPVGACFL